MKLNDVIEYASKQNIFTFFFSTIKEPKIFKATGPNAKLSSPTDMTWIFYNKVRNGSSVQEKPFSFQMRFHLQ